MSTKNTDSTVPAVKPANAVACLDLNAIDAIAENCKSEPLLPGDLDRVKVPGAGGTTWELPTLEGIRKADSFRGIILSNKAGRAYWPGEYNGDNTPPECLSVDSKTGRGTPGGNCEGCRFNEYESATKGKGKACKETRTLMVLVEGDLLPTVLRVPPSGLKGWRGYVMRLSKAGLRIQHAVTELSLNKTKSAGGIEYAEIVFRKDGALSADERIAIDRYVAGLASSMDAAHASSVVEQEEAPAPSGTNPFADDEDMGPAFPEDSAPMDDAE